jgi:hypothetical protein
VRRRFTLIEKSAVYKSNLMQPDTKQKQILSK